MCQGEEVAIKILFCMELTPESVVTFCEEASLLYSLRHANIVSCYGVSIMPPAVSIVTEFCHFGSLFDFLYNTDIISDFGSVAGRSSTHASQMSRGLRLAQISEKSQSSSHHSSSQSGAQRLPENSKNRVNSSQRSSKTPREGGTADESLLIETKPVFSLFSFFSWLSRQPGQSRNIVVANNETDRSVSDSHQQFYDVNCDPRTSSIQPSPAVPVSVSASVSDDRRTRQGSYERRLSHDDGNVSVASFDTVNQSSNASSPGQSPTNGGTVGHSASSASLLALETRAGAESSIQQSIGSHGLFASGRASSGRVSSTASAEGGRRSASNAFGVLQSITGTSFSPGSSFRLFGPRTASGSYQDTGALAFFVGSSADGNTPQQQHQQQLSQQQGESFSNSPADVLLINSSGVGNSSSGRNSLGGGIGQVSSSGIASHGIAGDRDNMNDETDDVNV